MPEFNLTDDEIQRLQSKFQDFKREREKVHELLKDYVADYRQFKGNSTQRYEHLRKKFISKSPSLSHLVSIDGSVLWSVNDISIILGRHRTTIQRTLDKLENSEGWCAKLISLRETSKAPSGLKIYVYNQGIFDLILDIYEEEYLLRFSEPRRGKIENAPDINEVRRFWNYLKDFNNFNEYAVQKKFMPEIPPMTLKDILALIWDKVFNVRTGTVCSVLFAVCFEISRRFFGVNIWLGIIPAFISVLCIMLIYSRKFSPDTLSNIGAGALLFVFLWISASLSVDRLKNEPEKLIPDAEAVTLSAEDKDKKRVLSSDTAWLYVVYTSFDNFIKVRINSIILESAGINCVESILYSINSDKLDKKINPIDYWDLRNKVFDYWTILKTEDKHVKSVTSQLIFKDGSVSEIRRSMLQ